MPTSTADIGMISTRLHGIIDYAVAALFAGLSTRTALPASTRACLGAAAAYHASYSALTDYEAGLQARLTMRQHLTLDTVGAAALCAAGLLLPRQTPRTRALLLLAGAAELAVVAGSSAEPRSGPGQLTGVLDRLLPAPAHPEQVGYPPLDTPKPFADGVWIVDSLMPGLLGRVLPVRMTILRLADGGLLLHSPTPFSRALLEQVRGLGRIRHLVAPNLAHWMFLQEWQRACPEATVWAAPGVRQRGAVRRGGLRVDAQLGDHAPVAWGEAVILVLVPGGLGFHEAALFHVPSRTLLLTDLVLNLEPARLPAVARPLIRMFGSTQPDFMPPPYLRAIVRWRRPEAAAAARRLLALGPQRVVFAHGRCFERDGTAQLRHAWRWLLA